MIEYRGIKLHEDVKLSNKQIKASLDFLADVLKERNCELLSEYKGNKEKVLIDFKCGHDPHWIEPSNFKSGKSCRKCRTEKVMKPNLEKSKRFQKKLLKMLEANEHKLLSDYISYHEKILIDFDCGHDPHWIRPSDYDKGRGCGKCRPSKISKVKQSKGKGEASLIALLKLNGHLLLSPYVHHKKKVLIDFMCGHDPHWITPSDYKNGYGCPHCNESKGQAIIYKWLKEHNIDYIAEYQLTKTTWRYDIYIPSHNMIVEVQGLQHYQEVAFFNRTLKQEQANDRNKRRYVERLGYNYMIVDYREHDPELTLERFIYQFRRINLHSAEKDQFSRNESKYEQLSLF